MDLKSFIDIWNYIRVLQTKREKKKLVRKSRSSCDSQSRYCISMAICKASLYPVKSHFPTLRFFISSYSRAGEQCGEKHSEVTTEGALNGPRIFDINPLTMADSGCHLPVRILKFPLLFYYGKFIRSEEVDVNRARCLIRGLTHVASAHMCLPSIRQ